MRVGQRRAAFLIRLFHHRWALVVMVEIARRSGSRFVVLQNGLGINPVSLRAALRSLRSLGLIRPNPGYGHPLRPEYLPTRRGESLAGVLQDLYERLRELGTEDAASRKWSMPVLDAIAAGRSRFGEQRSALPGLTPRALAQALKDLAATGLIVREVQDDYPPVPSYRPTAAGQRIARILVRIRV